jgi:hypothetical protein
MQVSILRRIALLSDCGVLVKSNIKAQKPKVLEFTQMQLVLGGGRRSTVSVTLENMVLAFEITFSPIKRATLLLLPVCGRPSWISPRCS